MSILTYTETLHQSQVLKEDAAESQFGHNQNTSLKAYVHASNLSKQLTSKTDHGPLCRGTSFITSCSHSGRPVVHAVVQVRNEGEIPGPETPG